MPHDKTSIVSLEEKMVENLAEPTIRLDEGFDRPYWEWIKSDSPNPFANSVWVPQFPSTLLVDGLLMLVAEGLQEPTSLELANKIRREFKNGRTMVDLDNHSIGSNLNHLLAESLKNYAVNILSSSSSGVFRQAEQLDAMGIKYRLFNLDDVE